MLIRVFTPLTTNYCRGQGSCQESGRGKIQTEHLEKPLRCGAWCQRLNENQNRRAVYYGSESAFRDESTRGKRRPQENCERVLLRERFEKGDEAESKTVVQPAVCFTTAMREPQKSNVNRDCDQQPDSPDDGRIQSDDVDLGVIGIRNL